MTFSKLMKIAESFPYGRKHYREKEKLVVTGSFSFFHGVFKRLVLQTCKNQRLFGKGLIYESCFCHRKPILAKIQEREKLVKEKMVERDHLEKEEMRQKAMAKVKLETVSRYSGLTFRLTNYVSFKGGPSDLGMKILQKY